ncbi:hypothetical protein QYF36_014757 [Acer negundo]|nr:hypothetical protein QYF36_014757 [Acer negundo]
MEDPDTDTDPESEWIIEECSSKENSGKFRWMLNKGLTVGKKMLLTAFVISSAPIVLPPLAVVSIIGFACSVPYGLFLASYACTNKLMSKLLPESLPPHPYLLEYGMVSSTDEQVENENDEYGGEGEDLGVYGDINRDKEEQGMWEEDTSKNVKMGIELVETDQGDEWIVLVGNGYGKKISGEMSGTTDFGFAENVDVVPMEMQPKPVVGVSGAEISTGEMSGTTDVGSNLAEEQKPVACKPSMSQGGRENDNIMNVVQQNIRLIRKKEIVLISSNADAREIADETGFDSFDNKNLAAQPYSYEGEHDDNDIVISSQKDVGMASNKVFLTEEKIWEKIEAMRTIVGYKAARQATCLEELKALYLFTGVEPPASFKDPCNEKLRFLMSIVGVK